MTWDRHRRHEAILKEKIAVIVLERLADPRLGFVTITGVELSRDKRHANVSYTCFGTEAQRRTTARALNDGAPRVQELLAPSLEMRLIPQLRFVHDDGVEKESKLLKLIEGVTAERVDRAGPDEPLEPSGDPAALDEDDERVASLPLAPDSDVRLPDASASLADRDGDDDDDEPPADEPAGDDGPADDVAPDDGDGPRDPS